MSELPETPGGVESAIGIGTEVKDIYETDSGIMVNVFVTGPKAFPMALKEARAKSKAVQAVGVADVTVDTFDSMVKNKEVERLTTVTGYERFQDEGYIRQVGSRPILDRIELARAEVVAFSVLVNAEVL